MRGSVVIKVRRTLLNNQVRFADLMLIECCNAGVVIDALQCSNQLVDFLLMGGIQVSFLRNK